VRLRARGFRSADYELTRVLRSLRAEGEVNLERGRWSASEHPLESQAPVEGASREPQLRERLPKIQRGWSPHESWLFDGDGSIRGEDLDSENETSGADDTGPWSTFRKLLDYYTDCVRNDEGCEASANLPDLGRRFVAIRPIGSWYPCAARKWRLRIPATEQMRGLIRTLAGAGDGGVLILGYPLWIYTRSEDGSESDPFLKPVFTYQLDYELEGDGIRVWADDPVPDVNLDWLSYALRRPDQQRSFLAAAGLMDRRGAEEQPGDGSGELLRPDFQSLATAVMTFFGDRVREPLAPESPTALRQMDRPHTGIYNHAVLMVANRTRYAQSLLKDLARIRKCSDDELDLTALRSIFRSSVPINESTAGRMGNSEAQDPPAPHEGTVVDTCDLNSEQRYAVASMLSSNVTVVTGPPGTGKSQVVASTVANARLAGQAVLFASRNHKAIDAVVLRPEMRTSDELPLIVRANDKEGAQSFGFADAIKELLSSPHDVSAGERFAQLNVRLQENLAERGRLAEQANSSVALRDELAEIEAELSRLAAGWTDDETRSLDGAPDAFPVQAVERLQHSIPALPRTTEELGTWGRLALWLRSRRTWRMMRKVDRRFAQRLPNWPSAISSKHLGDLLKLAERIPKLVAAARYCEGRLRQRPLEKRAASLPSLDGLIPEIERRSQQLALLAQAALSADAAARCGLQVDADRAGLASLQVALRRHADPLAANETRRQASGALAQTLPKLLWHFPAWAVTNLSIGSRIPLIPAMFDVAIIDEASQCDIASAIPVLFRARRAGVVGDPYQLAHTTKLTRSRDNMICKRHGIVSMREQRFSYPDTSLFDLFSQTNGVVPVLLRDHYRCAEGIAEYANRTFYGSRLRIVTASDRLRVPSGVKPGIHWTEIAADFEARRTGCVAPEEAEQCERLLRRLLLEDSFGGTVGIVTPFREQKHLLQQKVLSDPILAEASMRANLVIDTAHGFQGDERDVMFMSLCAGPGMPATSFGWLRRTGNLLNVAATRARAVLHVVGNRDWAARCGIPHIAALARPAWAPHPPEGPIESLFESPWEQRLYQAMVAQGLAPIPQYPLLGRRLDLALVEKGRIPIDVEVDGAKFHLEPDGTRRQDDIWRDITIRGAGWRVMRFWVYELRDQMDDSVDRIVREWNKS
jgi:very-short-patch-repair endonuclease/RecA/RadA recombinase